MNPNAPLPPMEPWLKAALDRPNAITERCQAPLEEVKKIFPLTEVEKKKKLKTSAEIFGKEYVWIKYGGSLKGIGRVVIHMQI